MALSRDLTEAERRALNQPETDDEILCDHTGCRNVAVEVITIVRDLNSRFAVCAEHLNLPAHTPKSTG